MAGLLRSGLLPRLVPAIHLEQAVGYGRNDDDCNDNFDPGHDSLDQGSTATTPSLYTAVVVINDVVVAIDSVKTADNLTTSLSLAHEN